MHSACGETLQCSTDARRSAMHRCLHGALRCLAESGPLCRSDNHHMMVDEFTQLGRSLINIRTNSGQRAVTCGTPDVTGLVADDIPSMRTVCSRSVMKDDLRPKVVPVTPIASSFFSRCLRTTLMRTGNGLMIPSVNVSSESLCIDTSLLLFG